MRRLSYIFALNLCVALLTAHPATAQRYRITDLGTLAGDSVSYGTGMSQSGEVTGFSKECDVCESAHAFLYRDGYMQDLGTFPGGGPSAGYGVSDKKSEDSGRWDELSESDRREDVLVAGFAALASCSTALCMIPAHAFLYQNGVMHDLGTLPGGFESLGYAVNPAGQVTGCSLSLVGPTHAFLYSHGAMHDLGALSGSDSCGISINQLGEVTGYSTVADGNRHAFLYSHGAMHDLGTLSGTSSSGGAGINQLGEVTGSSTGADGNDHAFLYSHGVMHDLGTLPGTSSSGGSGINRYGQIVGLSDLSPFLYSHGAMLDLSHLIPPNSGWILREAAAINDRGQIAGFGDHNGETHAFLLTPICTENGEHDRDCDEGDKQEQR
jgi:probable HAF family extracellular repeat protein